jgi:hypothetical protein
MFEASPEMLARPYLKNKIQNKRSRGVTQVLTLVQSQHQKKKKKIQRECCENMKTAPRSKGERPGAHFLHTPEREPSCRHLDFGFQASWTMKH